jgi:hypothetical protein
VYKKEFTAHRISLIFLIVFLKIFSVFLWGYWDILLNEHRVIAQSSEQGFTTAEKPGSFWILRHGFARMIPVAEF